MTAHARSEAKIPKTKVLIVDDHPIVRYGMAEMIRQESDLEVCGQAATSLEAMKALDAADVAIVDISLGTGNGIELIKEIHERRPETAILVISIHDESLYAERCLRAGAKGYVMKEEATETLVRAIRKVRGGEIFVSDKTAMRLLQKFAEGGRGVTPSPLGVLSDRELQVFLLIGGGTGTRQIAEQLQLSVKTVEAHRAHIKEKLGLKNSTELVRHAVRWAEMEVRSEPKKSPE